MSYADFHEGEAEPATRSGAIMRSTRRLLRRALRPVFVRLVHILEDVARRLESLEHRIFEAEQRLGRAEPKLETADTRLVSAEARLKRGEERTYEAELRLDAASGRIDRADWRAEATEKQVAVLFLKADGMAAHLEGLTKDHAELYHQVQPRLFQLEAIGQAMEGLGRRQESLSETLQAFQALHWDHVALARRLGVIEDLLATANLGPGGSQEPGDAPRSIPFPGLDGEPKSQVG